MMSLLMHSNQCKASGTSSALLPDCNYALWCNPQVTGYGKDDLATALKDADLVVIPAGVPRKPGMTRDDLFNINAGIVKTLVEGIAKHAPHVRPRTALSC